MSDGIVTMLDFVRKAISETEDLGSLTIRDLRTGFMNELKLQSLSSEEKETFRTIVDIALEENNQIKSSKKENAGCSDKPRMMTNTRKKTLTDSSETFMESCGNGKNGALEKQTQEKIESINNGKMGYFIGQKIGKKGTSHKKSQFKSKSEKSDTETEKCHSPNIHARKSRPKKRMHESVSENDQDNSPVTSSKKSQHTKRSQESESEDEQDNFPIISSKKSWSKKRLQDSESENEQDNFPVTSSKKSQHTKRSQESESENEQANFPIISSKKSQLTKRSQESESENEQNNSPVIFSKKLQLTKRSQDSESECEQDNFPIISSKKSQSKKRLQESESENEQDNFPIISSKKSQSTKRKHESESEQCSSQKTLSEKTFESNSDEEKNISFENNIAKNIDNRTSSDEDEKPLSLLGKTAGSSSSKNKLQLKHGSQSSSDKSSEDDLDQSENEDSRRGKKRKRQESGKSSIKPVHKKAKISPESKRKTDDDDPRIKRLKRYISTAGLRIKYGTVFEGCKTRKKKVEKLLQILKDEGLKGKPTLKSCKALKKKREKKQELKELDVSNIIDTNGERPRRGVKSLYLEKQPSRITEEMAQVKKTFSRLKEIIESEESD
ncbi:HIRA-interacting protein 3-like isoform X3 [Limulus polyphemus]|uniref:HIRA-interacting protein 3-like isoform X3 n=1 Tax=Limulus polyphemus TaxID=6850 RepID=A0ABM1TR47_LIMPO|nr:HIRA-interacting protein 3-like isoform X3 [Limulus polyphemus]